jgi:hypothetical protein
MSLAQRLAKDLKEFHIDGTWVSTNLNDQLADVDWQMATKQVYNLNSIAMLSFHINYYVVAVTQVLEGGPLDAHDRFSYDLPPITNEEDWQQLRAKVIADGEKFSEVVEKLGDENLLDDFADAKYGNIFCNLLGNLEHSYYHLGQIVLIKKILKQI